MKIKRHLLIPFIFLLLTQCKMANGPIEKIDTIEFSFYSGRRIPYNEVIVTMERANDSALVIVHSKPLNNDPKWEYSKKDTAQFVPITTFDAIAKSLNTLDTIDIDKAYTVGLDGYSCKIEFGAKGKNKSYRFWSPTTNTKKRGLTEFTHLCEQLLEIATLKKDEILEK